MHNTPRYQQILANAEAIAREFGPETVGVEHLQLAILRDPDAVPTQVLQTRVGVEPSHFATHLTTIMQGSGYNKTSNQSGSDSQQN